jgi:hypothetical protein
VVSDSEVRRFGNSGTGMETGGSELMISDVDDGGILFLWASPHKGMTLCSRSTFLTSLSLEFRFGKSDEDGR